MFHSTLLAASPLGRTTTRTRALRRTLTSSTLLLAALAVPSHAQGTALVEHRGASDPLSEGWQLQAYDGVDYLPVAVEPDGIATGPLVDDMGLGLQGWRMVDGSTSEGLTYAATLNPSEVDSAASLGWSLFVRMRLAAGAGEPVQAEYASADRTWRMVWSLAGSDVVVRLGEGSSPSGGRSYTLGGEAGEFHAYELRWDAVLATADLYVDGQLRIADSTGVAGTFGFSETVSFGLGCAACTGEAVFSEVSWSLAPATPPGADLLAYYPFDGDYVNAVDTSITALVHPGGGAPTPTSGVRGGAFHFDGDDHLFIHGLSFHQYDQVTIGAWGRTEAVKQQWLLTTHQANLKGPNILITAPSGSYNWTAWNGGSRILEGDPIETGAWEFVAKSQDILASVTRLHVGDNVYEAPYAIRGNGHLHVGRSPYWTKLGFEGDIDEVFAFSRVLGSNELRYVREYGPLAEDSDGDGVPDSVDLCPFTPDSVQVDSDGDGVGDACDLCPGFDDTQDADGNGVPDACDCMTVEITSPPVDASVCVGQDVALTVGVSGDESNTFQWLLDGNPIPDATSDTLTIASVDAQAAGTYTVEVTNDCGADEASAVLNVVTMGPAITSNPEGATLCPGDSLTLSASAAPVNGGALLYQWRKDGEDLVGEISATLALAAVEASSSGQYDVLVDEVDCGLTTSQPALVVVQDLPPIVTLNGSQTVHVECGVETYVEDGALATDTCDGSLAVTIEGPEIDSTVPGVSVLTYSATDSAGQTSRVTRSVVVRDTTPPVFTSIPSDLTLTCGTDDTAFGGWLASATASDDCGTATVSHAVSYHGACGSTEALVTWTARDESGNTATTSANYTELAGTGLGGVIFDTAEATALPEGTQDVLHVFVRNEGTCPAEIGTLTVVPDPNGVAASLHPSFQAPFLICPGQSLAIPVEVDTTGALPGTFRPEVVLEGATSVLPVTGTLEVRVSGEVQPNLTFASTGGLEVVHDLSPLPPEPYAPFELKATVRNNGVWPSSATTLNFFEGTTPLGSAPVPALAIGAQAEVDLALAAGLATGYYLLRAEIVPPSEGELSRNDNGLGIATQVGSLPVGGAIIEVQSSVSASCEGVRTTVAGRAEYVITSSGEEYRFPVQGALVTVRVDGSETATSQARTVLDGSFAFPVRFYQATSYDLLVEVTDFTVTGEVQVVYTATSCTRGGTLGEPGPPPPVTVPLNLGVCYQDIQVLGAPLSPGQDTTVEATVHYYNESGAPLADQPVSIYALEQTPEGFQPRFLGTRTVTFDGGGSATVDVPWTDVPTGDHVIRVELDPTVSQWSRDDVATRGISVLTTDTELETSIAIEFQGGGGCGSQSVNIGGQVTYVRAAMDPPGEAVACGEVTMRVFDETGSALLGVGQPVHTGPDGRFLVSSPAAGSLTPGSYLLEVTTTDGTWSMTEFYSLTCPEPGGGGYNVPTDYTGFDLHVYSEDIVFLATDCLGALVGWPYPGQNVGLRVTFHYTGADSLSGVPVEVIAHVPDGSELVPVLVGSAVLNFPGGAGFDTHCFPWTPELARPTIVQAVIDDASYPGQFVGNDAATRLLFVGNPECELALPETSYVVTPGDSVEIPVQVRSFGASTPVVALSLTADPSGDLPDGVSVSFSSSTLTLPGEATMTIQTSTFTPATTHQLLVRSMGSGCTALQPILLEVNNPPIAACPGEITLEATGLDGAEVVLDGSASTDPDFDTLIYQWDVGHPAVELDDPSSPVATGTFPIGVTVANLTVLDSRGGFSSCTVQVTVEDTTPPEAQVACDPIVMWPPNHMMRPVTIQISGTDAVDGGALTLLSVIVRSDEADNAQGKGDGNTTGDVAGLDGFVQGVDVTSYFSYSTALDAFVGTFELRSERAGSGDGRFYSIEATVLDSSLNEAVTTCGIAVPHDRRKRK